MPKKIFLIAGEASGDWLGYKLIRELKVLKPDIEFSVIGGKRIESHGVKSLFPITEIALMGFAEILPHITRLKRRINETIEAIRKFKPDVVVTIDSPGFNMRIAKALQDMRPKTKFIHYVAPTVWAYKPERAQQIAKLYDELLVILPFEREFFLAEQLPAYFVGHPVVEDGLDKGDAEAFRARHNLGTDEFICLMPGSRVGELSRMLPVFGKTLDILGKRSVVIAADDVRHIIEAETKRWKHPPLVIDVNEKADCFAACQAGLIKSGTAGLEFAFAGKPYLITYKINPVSAYMLRRMLRIQYVNLVNIIANEEIIPELLQEECSPDYIADNLKRIIKGSKSQVSKYQKSIAQLHPESGSPSHNAAEHVISLFKSGSKGHKNQQH